MPEPTPARVLIVEDDADVGTVLQELLAGEGYEVRWARDGQAGLLVLADWHPDVILLDLMMPVLDGRGFRARQLRLPDHRASIPVIVVSGAREARATAADLQAVAVLTKPFDLDEVTRTVARALEGTPSGCPG